MLCNVYRDGCCYWLVYVCCCWCCYFHRGWFHVFCRRGSCWLVLHFWGGDFFFFFWLTCTHSSTILGWAWSGSFPVVVSLMVAVKTVVATVSVATVAAAAAGAYGGSFLGQNFDICPNCLQLQQRERLPSTTSIICLSLLTMVSGIAWKPSQVRHIWNT